MDKNDNHKQSITNEKTNIGMCKSRYDLDTVIYLLVWASYVLVTK